MSGTREFWFQIEQVLGELSELLEQARARQALETTWPVSSPSEADPFSALGQAWRSAPPGAMTRMEFAPAPRPEAMGRPLPEPLFGRPLQAAEVSLPAGYEPDPTLDPDPRPAMSDEVTALRGRLRDRLTWLRSRLREGLDNRDAYLVLFPLVLHVDELAAEALAAAGTEWRPLQLDFFDVDDGGELFFSTLDQVLGADETPPLVLEVFLYCLRDGFVGRFAGYPAKLQEYRERLAGRIPTEEPPPARSESMDGQVELVEFPRRYYLYAAGTGLVIFLALRLWGAFEGSL